MAEAEAAYKVAARELAEDLRARGAFMLPARLSAYGWWRTPSGDATGVP